MTYTEARNIEKALADQRAALYRSWAAEEKHLMETLGLSKGPMGLLPDELLPQYRAFRAKEAAIFKPLRKVQAYLNNNFRAQYKRDLRAEMQARRAAMGWL